MVIPSGSAAEQVTPVSKGKGVEVQANEKVYANEKFGYTVLYPEHWFPSGIVYANAFEIYNYDLKNFQSTPERNRASVIIVDTVNENKEATDKFLDSLLIGENTPEKEHHTVVIDGHRAVRILRKVPAQILGKGASRAQPSGTTINQKKIFLSISTYIANGQNLISLEGSVPVEANAAVIEEIKKIEGSVRFTAGKAK